MLNARQNSCASAKYRYILCKSVWRNYSLRMSHEEMRTLLRVFYTVVMHICTDIYTGSDL